MSPKTARLELKSSLASMRDSFKAASELKRLKKSADKAQNLPVSGNALKSAKTVKSAKNLPKKRGLGARATLKALFSSSAKQPRLTESDLINAESALGGTLFGPVPDGHRREFFRYRHNIWVFHESWDGKSGEKLESTITFEVRENGVYKQPLGGKYVKIKDAELENFVKATKEYLKIIKAKLY